MTVQVVSRARSQIWKHSGRCKHSLPQSGYTALRILALFTLLLPHTQPRMPLFSLLRLFEIYLKTFNIGMEELYCSDIIAVMCICRNLHFYCPLNETYNLVLLFFDAVSA